MHTLRKLQVLFTITDICHVYGSFLIQSQSNQDGGFLRYQVGLNQLPADILHDVVAGATKQLKVDVYVQDYDVTFRNWVALEPKDQTLSERLTSFTTED